MRIRQCLVKLYITVCLIIETMDTESAVAKLELVLPSNQEKIDHKTKDSVKSY